MVATDRISSRWNIYSAIQELEAVQDEFYPDVTRQVVPILRDWAQRWDGHREWSSLLNKYSLHKELEESIVAIHHLLEATSGRPEKSIIVMDICAGKGLFSFLLSFHVRKFSCAEAGFLDSLRQLIVFLQVANPIIGGVLVADNALPQFLKQLSPQ